MRKYRRAIGLFVFLAVGGTALVGWGQRPNVNQVIPPLLAHPLGMGRDSFKVAALHGAHQDRVLAEIGKPNRTWEYPVDDAAGEFRIELRNTYPFRDPRNRDVRILEWQWDCPEFSFAVWFHRVDGRWIVLDTCRWSKDTQF